MKQQKLKIKYPEDRDNVVTALVNSGYKVWVEEEIDCTGTAYKKIYWVVYEDKETGNDFRDELLEDAQEIFNEAKMYTETNIWEKMMLWLTRYKKLLDKDKDV